MMMMMMMVVPAVDGLTPNNPLSVLFYFDTYNRLSLFCVFLLQKSGSYNCLKF